MKLIMLIAKTYLLFNWIWMKVKYGEWSAQMIGTTSAPTVVQG